MTQKPLNNICEHDYSMGYCPHKCFDYLPNNIAGKRRQFLRDMGQTPKKLKKLRKTKKSRMNPITKATIAQRLKEYHLQEQYPFGKPKNLITF